MYAKILLLGDIIRSVAARTFYSQSNFDQICF